MKKWYIIEEWFGSGNNFFSSKVGMLRIPAYGEDTEENIDKILHNQKALYKVTWKSIICDTKQELIDYLEEIKDKHLQAKKILEDLKK